MCAFPSNPVCLCSLGLKGELLVSLGRSQYRNCSLCLSLTEGAAVSRRLQLIDDLSYEDVKKCYRESVSKTCPRTEQQEVQRWQQESPWGQGCVCVGVLWAGST